MNGLRPDTIFTQFIKQCDILFQTINLYIEIQGSHTSYTHLRFKLMAVSPYGVVAQTVVHLSNWNGTETRTTMAAVMLEATTEEIVTAIEVTPGFSSLSYANTTLSQTASNTASTKMDNTSVIAWLPSTSKPFEPTTTIPPKQTETMYAIIIGVCVFVVIIAIIVVSCIMRTNNQLKTRVRQMMSRKTSTSPSTTKTTVSFSPNRDPKSCMITMNQSECLQNQESSSSVQTSNRGSNTVKSLTNCTNSQGTENPQGFPNQLRSSNRYPEEYNPPCFSEERIASGFNKHQKSQFLKVKSSTPMLSKNVPGHSRIKHCKREDPYYPRIEPATPGFQNTAPGYPSRKCSNPQHSKSKYSTPDFLTNNEDHSRTKRITKDFERAIPSYPRTKSTYHKPLKTEYNTPETIYEHPKIEYQHTTPSFQMAEHISFHKEAQDLCPVHSARSLHTVLDIIPGGRSTNGHISTKSEMYQSNRQVSNGQMDIPVFQRSCQSSIFQGSMHVIPSVIVEVSNNSYSSEPQNSADESSTNERNSTLTEKSNSSGPPSFTEESSTNVPNSTQSEGYNSTSLGTSNRESPQVIGSSAFPMSSVQPEILPGSSCIPIAGMYSTPLEDSCHSNEPVYRRTFTPLQLPTAINNLQRTTTNSQEDTSIKPRVLDMTSPLSTPNSDKEISIRPEVLDMTSPVSYHEYPKDTRNNHRTPSRLQHAKCRKIEISNRPDFVHRSRIPDNEEQECLEKATAKESKRMTGEGKERTPDNKESSKKDSCHNHYGIV